MINYFRAYCTRCNKPIINLTDSERAEFEETGMCGSCIDEVKAEIQEELEETIREMADFGEKYYGGGK